LVTLAFDDYRGLAIGDVVEAVQDLFCAFDLRKGFGTERPVFDVHQFAVAEIREGGAIGFAAERRDVVASLTDPVASGGGFADAAIREPAQHGRRRVAGSGGRFDGVRPSPLR